MGPEHWAAHLRRAKQEARAPRRTRGVIRAPSSTAEASSIGVSAREVEELMLRREASKPTRISLPLRDQVEARKLGGVFDPRFFSLVQDEYTEKYVTDVIGATPSPENIRYVKNRLPIKSSDTVALYRSQGWLWDRLCVEPGVSRVKRSSPSPTPQSAAQLSSSLSPRSSNNKEGTKLTASRDGRPRGPQLPSSTSVDSPVSLDDTDMSGRQLRQQMREAKAVQAAQAADAALIAHLEATPIDKLDFGAADPSQLEGSPVTRTIKEEEQIAKDSASIMEHLESMRAKADLVRKKGPPSPDFNLLPPNDPENHVYRTIRGELLGRQALISELKQPIRISKRWVTRTQRRFVLGLPQAIVEDDSYDGIQQLLLLTALTRLAAASIHLCVGMIQDRAPWAAQEPVWQKSMTGGLIALLAEEWDEIRSSLPDTKQAKGTFLPVVVWYLKWVVNQAFVEKTPLWIASGLASDALDRAEDFLGDLFDPGFYGRHIKSMEAIGTRTQRLNRVRHLGGGAQASGEDSTHAFWKTSSWVHVLLGDSLHSEGARAILSRSSKKTTKSSSQQHWKLPSEEKNYVQRQVLAFLTRKSRPGSHHSAATVAAGKSADALKMAQARASLFEEDMEAASWLETPSATGSGASKLTPATAAALPVLAAIMNSRPGDLPVPTPAAAAAIVRSHSYVTEFNPSEQ